MGGFLCLLLNSGRVLTPRSRHNFPPTLEDYEFKPYHKMYQICLCLSMTSVDHGGHELVRGVFNVLQLSLGSYLCFFVFLSPCFLVIKLGKLTTLYILISPQKEQAPFTPKLLQGQSVYSPLSTHDLYILKLVLCMYCFTQIFSLDIYKFYNIT